jgi:hypothetical protein
MTTQNKEMRDRGPGWIVDHIKPLCLGGADESKNMQWQTQQAAKIKDIEERASCRKLPRGEMTRVRQNKQSIQS